ncbi:MAG: TspO/MBR family protein [Burkholderiales bacterium]
MEFIRDKRHLWLGLAAFLLICFTAAGIGSFATYPAIPGWFASLNKPAWNPPSWLFGPVWTVLYAMMATAGWLVWRQLGLLAAATPLFFFAVQLMLNTMWSVFFFGLHNPGLAFVDIVFLWLAIAMTVYFFWRVRPLAGALLLPYLGWVSFAAVLNFTIWRLNP